METEAEIGFSAVKERAFLAGAQTLREARPQVKRSRAARSFAPIEHSFQRNVGAGTQFLVHHDFRRHVAQAIAQIFQRVHFHEFAFVAGADGGRSRDELFSGNFVAQTRDHVGFRDDDERVRRRRSAEIDHFFRRADDVRKRADAFDALGMHEHGRARELLFRALDFADAEKHVRVAASRPEAEFALRLIRDPRTEILVGNEKNFLVRGNAFDDFFRVPARADDVGKRFDFRAAVDVGDDVKVRIRCLVGGEFFGGAGIRERAAGFHHGQKHFFARIHDFRRFRHEMHAAEHDDFRVLRRFRLIRKPERVSNEIRHALNVRALVIVDEQHGVAFLLQTQNFFLQRRERRKLAVRGFKNSKRNGIGHGKEWILGAEK